MSEPQIEVYFTPWCGFCRAARRLLDGKGVAYHAIDVSDEPELRRIIRERSGQHTVPQIFIDGRSIGGYSELSDLDAKGELDALLGR